MTLLPQQVIRRKRDGEELPAEELAAFVRGVSDGSIPDYQVAAMLMAVFFRGMSNGELAAWADAMLNSGEVLDLSAIDRPKVDKHSTGGVGDKISLPLAPAVACCGVAVPMVSGRGLGHSGGTLDKLEAIPGFRVDLDVDRFRKQVDELGVCLIGQTKEIAPADGRLYALRDVTATVESIPLIASSIMSKKLAEGIDGLVLDVKVGVGAFMKEADDARRLFQAMKVIGEAKQKRVVALLTSMDAPIGTMVGNGLETAEAIEVLRGGGPADTRELTVRLGAEMLLCAGVADDENDAAARIERVLDDGQAAERFAQLVAAQGGDPKVVERPEDVLPTAERRVPVPAPRSGVVEAVNAYDIGVAGLILGAGRRAASDEVDPAVGLELCHRVGDEVAEGEPLAFLHENGRGVDEARARVLGAYRIGESATTPTTRILEVMR